MSAGVDLTVSSPPSSPPASDLRVTVLGARPDPGAVAPQMLVRLRVEEPGGAEVLAAVLHAQVRVEPQRRTYGDAEEQSLLDLFGDRSGWSQTVRPFLWAHATTVVPAFTGGTEVDLVLPCSYDVEVAGAKYLQALGHEGSVPLLVLFDGVVLARAGSSTGVEQVPWGCRARYDLPVSAWRAVMDQHFPGQAWLRADREAIAELTRYEAARGHSTWEQTLGELLAGARSTAR